MKRQVSSKNTFYLDIFEPPPTWRPHYYPRRSPLHHQPSLSEIVYQDYNESRLSSSYYQEYDSDYEDSQRNNDDGSMFTAAEDVGDEEFERHGHLLSSTEPIVDYMKRCHIQPTAEWKGKLKVKVEVGLMNKE